MKAAYRRARLGGEEGSAVVEFVFLGVLLMVPLIYLVMTLGRVQAGAYAASAAAREAGRAFVTAPEAGAAPARAEAAAGIAFADQGFPDGEVEIACSATPCLAPGGRVTTTARVIVPLPLVPSFARSVVPLQIPVEASQLSTVDRFRAGVGAVVR
jgi:hypothetical protein